MTGSQSSRSLMQRARLPLLIYFICLGGYMAASGGRLEKHSNDNHYVYLAKGLLEGRLSLKGAPPHQNDWALVYEITTRDGRTVKGSYLKTGRPHMFKTLKGERFELPPSNIKSRKQVYYVSFPWFPALLMMPFVAIWGMKFNDVIFNIMVGSLNPMLVFFVLRRLVALGHSKRELKDDLWLVGMFAFGTVHFYSSVIGQVWYTAHVVGVALTALYVLAALNARHLYLAGLMLGLGFVTRTPIPFSFALIVGEVLRRNLLPLAADKAQQVNENESDAEGDADSDAEEKAAAEQAPLEGFARLRSLWSRVQLPAVIRDMIKVGLPCVAVAIVAMIFNYARFGSPAEFGHTYLNVRWAERIQRWGLFNYHFLSRNLAVMLTLLPRIMTKSPYIQISWHGMALPVTTPLFVTLLRPKSRSPLVPWLYLSVLGPMVLHLLYQNSGWVQFGYRFSLDYVVYLMALMAIAGPKIGYVAKGLIIYSAAVNTFGAVTFGRMWKFYWRGMFPVP
jgi:hypothetical protein